LKYFGVAAKKHVSYTVASVSGAILAVCSCTILPLFAGLYKREAGIGPATTFLYSGPAINILAIVLTARVLGIELGVARAIAAVSMAIVIGLLMSIFFRGHDKNIKSGIEFGFTEEGKTRDWKISGTFFVSLIAILLVSTASISWFIKFPIIYASTLTISVILIFYYHKDEIKGWGNETWFLAKRIVPILLVGVFIVGIIGGIAAHFVDADPSEAVGVMVKDYIAGNSLGSNFVAAIIGAVLYMPTLLEVPIVNDLFGYSSGIMGNGPALALLLAGPSLSLPNMIVISRIMGIKKTGVYIVLVVAISTLVGFTYGMIV
jgi:uncharacterized membrane protein YraQ (UPF0718 family)